MTIDLIPLKWNKFIRNNYNIFFLGVGAAYYSKEPRAALVLNPALAGGALSSRIIIIYNTAADGVQSPTSGLCSVQLPRE